MAARPGGRRGLVLAGWAGPAVPGAPAAQHDRRCCRRRDLDAAKLGLPKCLGGSRPHFRSAQWDRHCQSRHFRSGGQLRSHKFYTHLNRYQRAASVLTKLPHAGSLGHREAAVCHLPGSPDEDDLAGPRFGTSTTQRRASRALAALRAADRVSATAVPSSTFARRSRQRIKPCGAPRPQRSRPREAPTQARAASAVAAERGAGAERRAHEATERAAQSITQARDAQRSNEERSDAAIACADDSARRAAERAEAAEPRADERSRTVDATQETPAGRPEQLPSSSPALQAPNQPQESVAAAPQRKRLTMPASA